MTVLERHCQTYPKLQVQDILKFLHQSTFGCEHLVSSLETATEYIEKEYATLCPKEEASIEPLDGNYSRVPISYLNQGLCADTLAKLFVASSKKEKDGVNQLVQKIKVVKELILDGKLPFSIHEFESMVEEWEKNGYPALHHSDDFRTLYRPAYRVIANEYIPFLPLCKEIDKLLAKGTALIAMEGGSASGKSTWSKCLEELYGCTVFHMDDFFLQLAQRTPERLQEVGGNIDWERFLSEVLQPLRKGKDVQLRKFDCSSMSLGEKEKIIPKKLVIVEGVYAMHPKLAEYYDFSVFLDISPELQKERILHRNTEPMAQRFFTEWIPMEDRYFEKTDIKNRCDMVIQVV